MKGRERKDILKTIPFFDEVLPPALKDDISGLSGRLHRAEKHTISVLFHCQERSREKLRVILYNLYSHLDLNGDFRDQGPLWLEWHRAFLLELDDFIFYVKEQQRVILEPNGLKNALGAGERSIIPPEMKDDLKKIADFQSVFVPTARGRFSGRGARGGGYRSPGGRAHRFRGRGRGFRGRGSQRSFPRPSSSFGGGDGYLSGGSDGARSSSRGKGRGRGFGRGEQP